MQPKPNRISLCSRLLVISLLQAQCVPYLNESVLRPEPGVVSGRPRVQGADVLSGPRPVAVQVEAVARLRPDQVAQAGDELGRVGAGPCLRLGLGRVVGYVFSLDLLEENGTGKTRLY